MPMLLTQTIELVLPLFVITIKRIQVLILKMPHMV